MTSFNGGCKQKFEFMKFYPQLAQREEYWDPMTGKAIHAAYQNYLVYRDEDKAIWELIKNFDLRAKDKKAWQPKTLEACYSSLMSAINYNQRLKMMELAYIKVNGEERPAYEVPFQINLQHKGNPVTIGDGIPVIYVGYIDNILVDITTGEYVCEDIKTHRDDSELKPLEFEFSEQVLPYAFVLSQVLGKPVDRLVARYLSVYVDLRKPVVQYFEYIKTPEMIQEWAMGVMNVVDEIRKYHTRSWWPRNNERCVSYGYACQFMDVCRTRNSAYRDQHFSLGNQLVMPWEQRKKFEPWLVMDLELDV